VLRRPNSLTFQPDGVYFCRLCFPKYFPEGERYE
jgi:hypothetical protein